MAEEEDEVDILGDFNLDNLLSKDDGRLGSCYVSGVLGSQGAELLNCDYNIGSQWLLDAPNQPWYSSPEDAKSYERHPYNFSNGDAESLPSTSQWEKSERWSEKEKTLLEQGLDLFGPSWHRLSQFVGTKNSQQVKHYVNSRTQVETLALESSEGCTSHVFNFCELIDDMQIPASMEEVIAVVSTARPTVTGVQRSGKRKGELHINRLKGRRGRAQPSTSRRQLSKPLKKSRAEAISPPVIMLSAGEEVVKIKKEGSWDSDESEEIDVDDVDESETWKESTILSIRRESHNWGELLEEEEEITETKMKEEDKKESTVSGGDKNSSQNTHSHQDVLERIFSMPPPDKEISLDANIITEEERSVHAEFFEGRSAKTPKRYLRIRNHILECWLQNRPAYVTKTSVRTGLKHCGDVNCIGRIHAYLERIGAINFGCEQAKYMQPAGPILPVVSARKKLNKREATALQQARVVAMRPRSKRKNPFSLSGDGGYTISHSDCGEVLHTTVAHGSSDQRPEKGHTSKVKTVRLIPCSEYSDAKPAPFEVEISAEALLVMDLHAHSSHAEVAGLLGGIYVRDKCTLHIRRTIVCRSNSSEIHCDICPVSQTEACEALRRDKLDVVGWYHSHPTFLPNPSQQDITTQRNMQKWFVQAAALPIVSCIVSPYCPTSESLMSQYRCLTLDCNENTNEGCGTPYVLPVRVSADNLNVASMLKDMAAILALVEENRQEAVDFDAVFQRKISYKQKCVESAKLHLESCRPEVGVTTTLFSDVAEGILQACSTLKLAAASREKGGEDV